MQLEEGQARKEAGVDVEDVARRLQYLTEPWSATEHEVGRPPCCSASHVPHTDMRMVACLAFPALCALRHVEEMGRT